jgi:hypothetical protein
VGTYEEVFPAIHTTSCHPENISPLQVQNHVGFLELIMLIYTYSKLEEKPFQQTWYLKYNVNPFL